MNVLFLMFWWIKHLSLRLWFSTLNFSSLHNIPRKGPIIIISNHSNAFIDPIVTAIAQFRSIYFLTRGDVFKPGFLNWFFRSLHMLPIFRKRDGIENLKKNPITFDTCSQLLSEGKAILLYPEGDCVQEKRLREFRPGILQILEQTYLKYPHIDDIHIVPVGLNYSAFDKPFCPFYMHIGVPISTRKLFTNVNTHQKDKHAFLLDMHSALAHTLTQIPSDPAQEIEIERWLEAYRTAKTGVLQYLGFRMHVYSQKAEQAIVQAYLINPIPYPGSIHAIFNACQHTHLGKTWIQVLQLKSPYGLSKVISEIAVVVWRLINSPILYLSAIIGKNVANSIVKEKEFWPSVRYGVSFITGIILGLLLYSIGILIFILF